MGTPKGDIQPPGEPAPVGPKASDGNPSAAHGAPGALNQGVVTPAPPPAEPPPAEAWDGLRQILKWHKKDKASLPYVVVHSIGSRTGSPSIKQSDFPGLHYVQIVNTRDGRRLISLWTNEGAFQDQEEDLAGVFDFAPGADSRLFEGPQTIAVVPKARAIRRFRTWLWEHSGAAAAILAGLAGLLSHVDSIVDWTVQNFKPAAVSVAGGQAELPVGKGQRFSTVFDLQNESSFASSYMRVETAEIFDSQGKPAPGAIQLDEFRGQTFSIVKPGESRSLTLSGRAIEPGIYTLKIEGFASRPRPLWYDGRVEFTESRKIDVWKPISLKKEAAKPTADGNQCKIGFQLRAGKPLPRGLECSADLTLVPNTNLTVVAPGVFGQHLGEPNETPANEAVSISWNTVPLERFDQIRGNVILTPKDGKPLSQDRWREIAAHLAFNEPVERPVEAPTEPKEK
jgi:hypothetical protein